MVLDIDTDYLLAQGFADLDWPQVVATLNDPPNQAQLIGSDINSQATGLDTYGYRLDTYDCSRHIISVTG